MSQLAVEIIAYNEALPAQEQEICTLLAQKITSALPEASNKIWHAHPVWFIDDNPIVGYSREQKGIRLMFWSGSDFVGAELPIKGKKFKDASIFYQHTSEIIDADLADWLRQARDIQWDYKNIVKRKGVLERLK
jgi:hypothetical protein